MKNIWRVALASAVFSAVLTAAISDADARGRSDGGHGHAAAARSHAGGGHRHAGGARSHSGARHGHAAGARSHSGGHRGHAAGARRHAGGGHARHQRHWSGHVGRAPVVVTSPRWHFSPGYAFGYDPFFHQPYYPPAAYAPEQDLVFVEQQAPAPANVTQAPATPYWYYCEDSKTYYPYVQACATPWQRVIPYAPQ